VQKRRGKGEGRSEKEGIARGLNAAPGKGLGHREEDEEVEERKKETHRHKSDPERRKELRGCRAVRCFGQLSGLQRKQQKNGYWWTSSCGKKPCKGVKMKKMGEYALSGDHARLRKERGKRLMGDLYLRIH